MAAAFLEYISNKMPWRVKKQYKVKQIIRFYFIWSHLNWTLSIWPSQGRSIHIQTKNSYIRILSNHNSNNIDGWLLLRFMPSGTTGQYRKERAQYHYIFRSCTSSILRLWNHTLLLILIYAEIGSYEEQLKLKESWKSEKSASSWVIAY